MSDGYTRLACAVVSQCITDFVGGYGLNTGCYEFLTGQTEIAEMWLAAANITPLHGSQEEVYRRLKT